MLAENAVAALAAVVERETVRVIRQMKIVIKRSSFFTALTIIAY